MYYIDYYIDYLYIYRCAYTHSELFRELFSHSNVCSLCIYMFSPMKCFFFCNR